MPDNVVGHVRIKDCKRSMGYTYGIFRVYLVITGY